MMKSIMYRNFETSNKNLFKLEYIKDTSFIFTISICDLWID